MSTFFDSKSTATFSDRQLRRIIGYHRQRAGMPGSYQRGECKQAAQELRSRRAADQWLQETARLISR